MRDKSRFGYHQVVSQRKQVGNHMHSCLSLIVLPNFVDPVRLSTTVLSQENTPLPSSVSIKPLNVCKRSKPTTLHSTTRALQSILSNISHRTHFIGLTTSLSFLGYYVYNLDCIVEIDEPLFFTFFHQWSSCQTPKPRPETLPLLCHSWLTLS